MFHVPLFYGSRITSHELRISTVGHWTLALKMSKHQTAGLPGRLVTAKFEERRRKHGERRLDLTPLFSFVDEFRIYDRAMLSWEVQGLLGLGT